MLIGLRPGHSQVSCPPPRASRKYRQPCSTRSARSSLYVIEAMRPQLNEKVNRGRLANTRPSSISSSSIAISGAVARTSSRVSHSTVNPGTWSLVARKTPSGNCYTLIFTCDGTIENHLRNQAVQCRLREPETQGTRLSSTISRRPRGASRWDGGPKSIIARRGCHAKSSLSRSVCSQ